MKAVYAGSFDPFTNGHLYLYNEAKKLFDEVHVLVAINSSKFKDVAYWDRDAKLSSMSQKIKNILGENSIVIAYYGLVAKYCKENNITYLIRGLRNTSDYMYEENIAKINGELFPDLKTIYFRADNEIISSTMVRSLLEFGEDVSKYLPKGVLDV